MSRQSTAICRDCGRRLESTNLRGARQAAREAGWIVGDHLYRSLCDGCREQDLRTQRSDEFRAKQAADDAEYTRRLAIREANHRSVDEPFFAQGRRQETDAMAKARNTHERAWSTVPNVRPGTF